MRLITREYGIYMLYVCLLLMSTRHYVYSLSISRPNTKDLHLYQAADSKLNTAFINSKYDSKYDSQNPKTAYDHAITFHIPSVCHDPTFATSMTGKLFGLSASSSSSSSDVPPEEGEGAEHEQLLKMKQVTDKEWKLDMKKTVRGHPTSLFGTTVEPQNVDTLGT